MATPAIMLTLLVLPWLLGQGVRTRRGRALLGCLGLTLVFLFTGASHFLLAEQMALLIPPGVPGRVPLVYVSGAIEIIAGLLLLPRATRRATGIFVILMLMALLPLNIYAAIERVPFGGHEWGPSYLLIRIPLQVILVSWCFWFAVLRWQPTIENAIGEAAEESASRRPMLGLLGWLYRRLTVDYRPNPNDQTYLERLQTQSDAGLTVSAAALSNRESHAVFGVKLARRGMQPLWLQVKNDTAAPVRLDLYEIDPLYFASLEAAYINHFSLGKRLLSFGLLAWIFLPLLPLLPFKLLGARAANRLMDAYFKAQGFRGGPIMPGEERSGFVFTALDEGTKNVDVKIVAQHAVQQFLFSLEVPGLTLPSAGPETALDLLKPIDERGLLTWLATQPACTTNHRGSRPGDPLNLVVVGCRDTVLRCFGARWDEAETITLGTCWKTFRAFLLDDQYRYSPVSPLYYEGRIQELALQKARASINQRLHLRLWKTNLSLAGERVWIGQVSRDIGVRFTPRTWNLTTHRIDPDVDEARDYVIDYLMATNHATKIGYTPGVGAAPITNPRANLTDDPYFTDGQRAIVILSAQKTEAQFLESAE